MGGFVHVISVLVSMEGCLSQEKELELGKHVYQLLRSVFVCLAVAMRYEPANARYFQVEVAESTNFMRTIQKLGCFSDVQDLQSCTRKPNPDLVHLFTDIFQAESMTSYQDYFTRNENPHALPQPMYSAAVVVRMLYDMALDNYDNRTRSRVSSKSSLLVAPAPAADLTEKRKSIGRLDLSPVKPEPVIVHPSIVVMLLRLLPHAFYPAENEALSLALQLHLAETVRSLLRQEKNQQIMSDAALTSQVMSMAKAVLEDEAHVLHETFQYLLERLAAQKLDPKDLRTFFRLGNPLSCLSDEDMEVYLRGTLPRPGGFIPLTRVKTLVSMTTPRDFHILNNSILPPFIELDMGPEGFGCLYVPSLAPSSPHAAVGVASLASQEASVIGGIGAGDRAFPPQPGLSYATWFCIDKFSDPRTDPHPVRLLTLVRVVKNGAAGNEEHWQCLAVCLSARDKALILSVQETPFAKAGGDWQPEFSGEYGTRVWFPDLIKEGEWHHLVVVLNRQVLKNASFSLYVNGQHISTQK